MKFELYRNSSTLVANFLLQKKLFSDYTKTASRKSPYENPRINNNTRKNTRKKDCQPLTTSMLVGGNLYNKDQILIINKKTYKQND